jgi:hypothetical protein
MNTGQSSIPRGVTRIVPAPVDSEADSPSDLVQRTKDVRYTVSSFHCAQPDANGTYFRCTLDLLSSQHRQLPLVQRVA